MRKLNPAGFVGFDMSAAEVLLWVNNVLLTRLIAGDRSIGPHGSWDESDYHSLQRCTQEVASRPMKSDILPSRHTSSFLLSFTRILVLNFPP